MSGKRIFETFFVFLALSVVVSHGGKPGYREHLQVEGSKSNEFDVLILAQNWPQSVCYDWMKKSPNHQCTLPDKKGWLIHGLWPLKLNGVGPFNCDRKLLFNMDVLKPLAKGLASKWMNVHKGEEPAVFWKHQWEKHGTCAAVLAPFSTQYKYFKESITLFDKYDMKRLLSEAKIMPGKKYKVQTILDGVAKLLHAKIQVTCITHAKTQEEFLSEVRICFDKKLKLKDCDGIHGYPTNCSLKKEVTYPDSVPT